MPFDKQYTPFPPVADAPVQVTVGDWFDLPARDTVRLNRHRTFRDQVVTIDALGGRPEPGVTLATEAVVRDSNGRQTERTEYETTATGGFDHPVDRGPLATDVLTFEVENSSTTAYTQAAAGEDPYQFYTTYTVRGLTIIDKLRRNIPITREEEQLMQKYNLRTRSRLNAPPVRDPIYNANLDGKTVAREDAEVTTVDVPGGGESASFNVLDVDVRPDEVVYLERLSVNGQAYTPADGLELGLIRARTDEFYRLETWGVPGQPFELDLHLPFFDNLQLVVWSQNPLADVDIRAEYATARRTLQEKALYGLQGDVRADDDLADARAQLYQTLRELLRTGLPLEATIEREAADLSTAAQAISGPFN